MQAAGVPRFGNQSLVAEYGIGPNGRNQARFIGGNRAIGVAIEDRCQIKPKAVHMILLDPTPHAFQNHPARMSVFGVQRVSRAGVIDIRVFRISRRHVITAVVNSFQTIARTKLVSFSRMVENNIQEHFDACPMQLFDHLPKLLGCPDSDFLAY